MFNFFKFILSWKFIVLAVAGYFIGDHVVDNLLDQASTQAEAEHEQLKEDIDNFDLDEIEGVLGKVKIIANSIKEKISQIIDQYQDEH